MKQPRPVWLALIALLIAAPVFAQGRGKREKLVLGTGKLYRNLKLNVELKIPKQFVVNDKNLPHGMSAIIGMNGYNFQVELGRVRAATLEDMRENLIKSVKKDYPGAVTQFKRGFQVGGMKAMSILVTNIRLAQGRDYMIYNIVDVPLQGILRLVIVGQKKELDLLQSVNDWMLPTFRLSGELGDDLIFEPRVISVETGLSYRAPKGTVAKPAQPPAVVYEGTAPGGLFVRVDAVQEAGGGDLGKVLEAWAKGAPARSKPAEVATQSAEGKAALALFGAYGGRPERALLAFRPRPDKLFRVEVAGKEMPMLHAERMAGALQWLDIPALEQEVAGWMPKVESALRAGDETKLKRYARRAADRYYLKASMKIAHAILKDGPEKAQVYALGCIERGGSVQTDFNDVKKAISHTKNKDRTKMRVAAAEAMGSLLNLACTNYLMRLARSEKDDMVARAAILALGRHQPNRKKIIPTFVREWDKVEKDRKSRSAAKKLRASRLGVAYRDAMRMLTGADLKDPKAARDWERENKKILAAEELVK